MKRSLSMGLGLLALLGTVGGLVRDQPGQRESKVDVPKLGQALGQVRTAGEAVPVDVAKAEPPADSQSSRLAEAIDRGQPLRLQLPGHEQLDFAFRDFPLLTDDYQTTLGLVDRLPAELRVFEGLAMGSLGQVHRASLVLTDRALAGVVQLADGQAVNLRGIEGESFLALGQALGQAPFICVSDPRNGESRTMSLDPDLAAPDWSQAEPAKLEPSEEFPMLASSGIDPVTGAQTLVLDAPANPQRYEASLKIATVIVALDKSATGRNTNKNLTEVTSQYLALMANVAAIYENQLGIRLLVQELILTPDSLDYDDITYDVNGETLREFASWTERWRPESTYGQTLAIRFGGGLTGGTLGIAYQNALHTRNGVGVMRTGFGWALPGHEMGHVFGSAHSLGGIMNAQYNNSTRTFFRDIEGQEITAAKQIHGRAAGRLSGTASMRNPAEMPFATDDVAWGAVDEQIRYDVLANDLKQVERGQENNLTLVEVGQVTPRYAGSVMVEDSRAVFTPSSEFSGMAWFSYSLRGDVGRGWLHKADVAVIVGDPEGDIYEMDVAAGQAKTFKLPGDGVISQVLPPKQAELHELPSDASVHILRVNADAKGSETIQYRAGGQRKTLKLNYINAPPVAEPDRFVLAAGETLNFNPLMNDRAAGGLGTYKTEPVIGVGTTGEGSEGQDYFPDGFRLVSARSKASRLGSLTVHRSPMMKDGRRRNEPNGLLTFKAKQGASGSGVIEYTIEDALGQRATGTVTLIISGETESLINSSSYVRGWVPTSNRDDAEWTAVDFDDSLWERGRNGAGYERSFGYMSLINTALNFRTEMYNRNETLYLRYTFDVENPEAIDDLVLRMKYDDGFIAFLNGKRVAAANAPSTARWNSGAIQTHSDSLALEFQPFEISSYAGLLDKGKNVLAIHGLNRETTSSDMLILAELVYANDEESGSSLPICEPPAERTSESILLAGRLAKQAPNSEVYFVWGKTDAGPKTDQWEHTQQIKSNTEGELRHLVDGLSAGEVLYYRIYEDGPYGTAWSEGTQKTSTLAKGILVARPDEYQVGAGEVLRLAKRSEGLQGNDVGIRAATQSRLLANPKHGELSLNLDGTFTYMADEGFTGEDSFLYRLSDTAESGAVFKTIVSVGGDWRYSDKATAPNRNWAKPSFDDNGWKVGPGLLGYGNGNEATVISFGTNPDRKNVTAYFRQTITVDDVALVEKVTFKLLRDDAAAVYLNGLEIYRDKNLSRTARHTTPATSSIVNESAFATFEVEGSRFAEGENVIAAEVHQSSRTSSDLSFALFGQAKLIPGNRVLIKVDSGKKTEYSISFNVAENRFEIVFELEMQKKYILETSVDLTQWVEVQVIEGKGDELIVSPDFDVREGVRFFRVIERP